MIRSTPMLFLLALASITLAEARTPEAILADYEAVEIPNFRDWREQGRETRDYAPALHEARQKQSALALEFYRAAPHHERAGNLMARRWSNQVYFRELADLLDETAEYLAAHEDDPARAHALYYRANALGIQPFDHAESYEQAVHAFLAECPDDNRGGTLKYLLAKHLDEDRNDERIGLLQSAVNDYPPGRFTEGRKIELSRAQRIGQPFDLSFTDLLTGNPITTADLKGKVVVIDFWASWCAPCKGEFPHMKKLYAQYQSQGLEIVGISLDDPEAKGGLDKLHASIAEEQLPWLQYYAGNAFESEIAKSWHVSAIPTVFILDADGNLYATNARGRLDELIPKLLAKRDAAEAEGAEQ